LNSTRLGPVGENSQSLQRGRALSFSGQHRHHLHNRQCRSHARNRAQTLHRKDGLSCRARLCRRF